MKMNTAEAFLQEGILVDPDMSEPLKQIKFPLVNVIKSLNINFLSKRDLLENYAKIKMILESLKNRKSGEERERIIQTLDYFDKLSGSRVVQKTEVQPVKVVRSEEKRPAISKDSFLDRKVKILKCYNHDDMPKDITVKDFVSYFKSRYEMIKNIIKQHSELHNLTLINKLSSNNKNISIIGMVYSKRITKNNNVMYEIEDLTGKIKVLVNVNKPELIKKTKEIILDEVVGFRCSGNAEILFANDIVFPDINTLVSDRRRIEEEEYAVFTSDIHLGHKLFLGKQFQKFIDWINGKTGTDEQKAKTKKIKYLFLTGDSVDGVGVTPGQEHDLIQKDLREQYKGLAYYLGQIRKDVTIIMCPGQHDSVRVAEPQPPIREDYAEELCNMDNVIMVSNPALIEIGAGPGKKGVRVLMYHGASFHPTRNEIEELRLGDSRHRPTQIIKYFLKKRHLGLPHTTTTHVPIPEGDPLVIDIVPEVLVTGDMHRTDVANYKGVLTINSSCWLPQTPFQEKVGNIPDPCKAPVLNLKTWELKILNFN